MAEMRSGRATKDLPDLSPDVAPAGNVIRAGQEACLYSLRIPPRHWCLRMSRLTIWSGSVIVEATDGPGVRPDALMGPVLL
jgi:hypothetical protein